jgi:hypothetical protein
MWQRYKKALQIVSFFMIARFGKMPILAEPGQEVFLALGRSLFSSTLLSSMGIFDARMFMNVK